MCYQCCEALINGDGRCMIDRVTCSCKRRCCSCCATSSGAAATSATAAATRPTLRAHRRPRSRRRRAWRRGSGSRCCSQAWRRTAAAGVWHGKVATRVTLRPMAAGLQGQHRGGQCAERSCVYMATFVAGIDCVDGTYLDGCAWCQVCSNVTRASRELPDTAGSLYSKHSTWCQLSSAILACKRCVLARPHAVQR
jgi:hypothetical protein